MNRTLHNIYLHQTIRLIVTVAVLLCSLSLISEAQILRDTAQTRKVNKCVGYIYNFRFSEAEQICDEIELAFPKSPAVPLIRGMIIYWKNYPLLPWSEDRSSYEKQLQQSIQMSEKKSPRGDEAEYLLADMCARGLMLLFYSDNDMSREVFPLATGTYRYLRESFKFTSVCPDFYFFTGLYDYYREKYPEIHPVYKPLAVLFPAGNAEKGLAELQKAFRESIVLNAEAGGFLSWIYSGYEFDYSKSLAFSRLLYEKYPGNVNYLANLIKYLLMEKKYDEAENLITQSGEQMKNTFFSAQVMVFRGILQEKKYGDTRNAEESYREGLKALSAFGDYANEYSAYAYFGLSRIAEPGKSGDIRKKYRKEALHLAEFRHMTFDE